MGRGQFSARFDQVLLDRLAEHGRRTHQPKSRLAERYIDEGLRMAEHPGIIFREGPTGRRAALAAGPDVWELVRFVQGLPEKGGRVIDIAAEALHLSAEQVETALGYYVDYREEIDERITADVERGRRIEQSLGPASG